MYLIYCNVSYVYAKCVTIHGLFTKEPDPSNTNKCSNNDTVQSGLETLSHTHLRIVGGVEGRCITLPPPPAFKKKH